MKPQFRIAASLSRLAAIAALALGNAAGLAQPAADPLNSPAWPDLPARLGVGPLEFDPRVVVIAPETAEDPLNVPVTVRTDDLPDVERVLVVADLNPILKVLEFEPLKSAPRLSFRMKLQQGSPVRALAKTRDGRWHVGGTWVETDGGGCTAPSVGRSSGNRADTLGQVESRRFPQASGSRIKLRVMHPMDTGLAPGIPAFFIETLTLRDAQGGEWARITTYEPVSENPVFSIDFASSPPPLRLIGRDNNGNRVESALQQ